MALGKALLSRVSSSSAGWQRRDSEAGGVGGRAEDMEEGGRDGASTAAAAAAAQEEEERWASILPELLREIVRRVEAGGERWPMRKDVVSCACVCRSWREVTRGVVRPPLETGKITFPSSLKQVLVHPLSSVLCGAHIGYIISLDADDLSQGSNAYVGKLRLVFLFCFPLCFCSPQLYQEEDLLKSKAHSPGMSLVLQNKAPRWHEHLQCWCLNFHGRVTVASVKNFQLVATADSSRPGGIGDDETVLLQFGKVGNDMFTMDYRQPLSAFQAFAICLTSFGTKFACE
ncbi:hypothetical protein BHE74_00056223 [Ensete ventricosum]|nr:hypothetical protein BHE74_00056223 [Ensete ventricosum]